jgi:exopolysaccharide biosynthesis polyprenyl glycosylphosphotransferase
VATSKPVASETNRGHVTAVHPPRFLTLNFSERRLLLGTIDGLLLNTALLVTLDLRLGLNFSLRSVVDRWPWFVLLTIIWFVCSFMLECYHLSRAASVSDSVLRVSGGVLLTSLIYLLIPYITPVLPTSRADIVAFPLLAAAGISAWRVIYATVLVQPSFQQRALIIGAGASGVNLVQILDEVSRHRSRVAYRPFYQILGFIDDDPLKQGTVVEGVPVIGAHQSLLRLVERLRPSDLIIAITAHETINAELFEAILACREMGIAVTDMATLYERLTGRVPIEHAGRNLYIAIPLQHAATHRFYLMLQRLFDIAVGLAGGVLLLMVVPWVWLANRWTSPGPLFYSQERIGKGGAPFLILKFRSMRTDAEQGTGAVWASENDPRITPVGRFLRKTRVDEIPQFWNVLRGDMSLIGPRPERPQFVEQLALQIPFYRVRHAVKPGLTGWAQVQYRYGASVEDSLIKLQYDLFYIKHQGPLLDLKIVLKTLPIVLGFKGR